VAERENRLREREGLCGLGVFGCGWFSCGEKRMGMACVQSREGRESEGMKITNLVSKEGGQSGVSFGRERGAGRVWAEGAKLLAGEKKEKVAAPGEGEERVKFF